MFYGMGLTLLAAVAMLFTPAVAIGVLILAGFAALWLVPAGQVLQTFQLSSKMAEKQP